MDNNELRDVLFDALIERFGESYMDNPAYDRKAERAAWKNDEDYDIPEYIPADRETQKRGSCTQVFVAADGYNSISILNFTDIVNAVMAEFIGRNLIVSERELIPYEDA